MEEFPIVMCIYGEGELCNGTCPLMDKCWPNWKKDEQKTDRLDR
jgi:hypothetical protein